MRVVDCHIRSCIVHIYMAMNRNSETVMFLETFRRNVWNKRAGHHVIIIFAWKHEGCIIL